MVGMYGTLTVTRCTDPLGVRVHIAQADPRVIISDELLADIKTGRGMDPQVVRYSAEHGTVTLTGENQTVIYRIREYVPAENCWLMEWPD